MSSCAGNGRRIWQLRFCFSRVSGAVDGRFVACRFLLACLNTIAPLGWLEKIGAGIWLVSICGEAVRISADRFRKNPRTRGKPAGRGLWDIRGTRIIFSSG